jgi:hypothetical protein
MVRGKGVTEVNIIAGLPAGPVDDGVSELDQFHLVKGGEQRLAQLLCIAKIEHCVSGNHGFDNCSGRNA